MAASGKQERDKTPIVQVLAQMLFLRKGLPSPPNLSYKLTPSLSVTLAYFHSIYHNLKFSCISVAPATRLGSPRGQGLCFLKHCSMVVLEQCLAEGRCSRILNE